MLKKGLTGATIKEKKELENYLEHVCTTIQNKRQQLGYTQEELAERLDINVNTLKYIEQGRRIPSLPMLIRICWKMGLELKIS
jgi:DNA-binding XRE family transcriptional regulator